jgi:hypothetical protein
LWLSFIKEGHWSGKFGLTMINNQNKLGYHLLEEG